LTISERRQEAVLNAEVALKMGGEGIQPKARAQDGCSLSLMIKEGVSVQGVGGQSQGEDQVVETRAWSELRERSRTEECWAS
jgi:hypothetical protein